jgi:hypothetical protein
MSSKLGTPAGARCGCVSKSSQIMMRTGRVEEGKNLSDG